MHKKIIRQRKILALVQVSLLVITRFWLPFSVQASSEGEVDVVVSRSSGAGTLSLDDVQKIFRCEKSVWPSGKRIVILMLAPGQPERSVILREIYKMSEPGYSKYFLEAIFTGRLSAPPKEVNSPAQMKQYLSSNPWAVGYLKKQDVDDTVKVVFRVP